MLVNKLLDWSCADNRCMFPLEKTVSMPKEKGRIELCGAWLVLSRVIPFVVKSLAKMHLIVWLIRGKCI